MINRWQWPLTPAAERTRQAAEKHFGRDVPPDCLRISADGTVRVAMDGNWPELVQSLGSFEELTATTGNQAASLTQTGVYPQLKICACGRSACSADSNLAFDFSAWQRVWASRRQMSDGVRRALTVAGPADFSHHQVLFPDEMADAYFDRFVGKLNPVPAAGIAGDDFSPRIFPAARESKTAELLERFRQRKIEFVENAASRSRPVHRESLAEVWRNVLAERLRIGTTILTAPVIHSALWQPVSLTENTALLTASSDTMFFCCRPEKISEVWVVPLSTEPEPPLALEVYDAHNDLLFALAVSPEWKNIWDELLHWLPAA